MTQYVVIWAGFYVGCFWGLVFLGASLEEWTWFGFGIAANLAVLLFVRISTRRGEERIPQWAQEADALRQRLRERTVGSAWLN